MTETSAPPAFTDAPPPARRRTGAFVLALLAVVAWLGIGAVAGPAVGGLADVQTNDSALFLPDEAESTRALVLERAFDPVEALPAVVVYERTSGLTAADRAKIAADVERFAQLDGLVGRPLPPQPSEDGQALQVVLPLEPDFEVLPAVVEAVRGIVGEGSGPEAYVTGPAGLTSDLVEVFGAIDTTLLLATALVVVTILLLVYRSPFLWVLPLLSVALAFSLAAGIIYVLAREDVLALDGQSQGILTVLVFGAGTDYALLLIARYREELQRHRSTTTAMLAAMRGAVPAIAASAATVVLGLLCLLVSQLNSNRGLGPVAAIGIAAAFLAMTTLLPALLVLAGRRVFWPRVPRYTGSAPTGSRGWERVAGVVGRRPRRVAVLSGGLLVVLSLGVTQLQATGLATSDAFVSEVDSVSGQQALGRHFPAGTGSPTTVIGPADEAGRLSQVVAEVPGVSAVRAAPAPADPPPTVQDRALLQVVLSDPADSLAARVTVERLREAVDAVGDDVLVGGVTAVDADVQAAAQRDRLLIIPLVLLVILLVLCLLLRSIIAPLMLVGTVVLSFTATLGVCAVVFRHVFGFAGADSVFPLFAFVFLVALGIDYNIFLMTRVREESQRLGTRDGVLRGLVLTGAVITSAGIVLAATFSVLGVLPLVVLAELGFAVAFGVLLDTLLVRSLLVPALTLELGDRVWWPSALARRES